MDDLAAEVLRRCAGGEISSAVALVRVLIAYGDLDRLRAALADLDQADGDADLRRRDRAHARSYRLQPGR